MVAQAGFQLGLTGLQTIQAALSATGIAAGSVFGLVASLPGLISRLVPADPRSVFGAGRALPEDVLIAGLPSFGAKTLAQAILPSSIASARVQTIFSEAPGAELGFSAQSLFSVLPEQVAIGEAGITRFLNQPLPTVAPRVPGLFRFPAQILGASQGQTSEQFLLSKQRELKRKQIEEAVPAAIQAQIGVLSQDPIFQGLLTQTLLGQIPGAEINPLTAAAFNIPQTRALGGPGSAAAQVGGPSGSAIPAPLTRFKAIPISQKLSGGVPMPEVSTSAGGLGAFGGFIEGLGGLVSAVSPIISPIIAANFPRQPPLALPGGASLAGFQGQFQDPRLQTQQASLLGLGGQLGLGLGLGAIGENLLNLLPGGAGQGGLVPIQPITSMTTRFPRTVSFTTQTPSGNPKVVTYRNMGSCLLFSGDLSAAKRVRRIASKARRRVGGR